MPVNALFFGSIGVLAETSELQRAAFNDAFAEAGLDWHWSERDYAELLTRPGGQARIERVAEARGEQVDAAAIHARKSELFQARMLEQGLTPRPGVLALIEAARRVDLPVALVTTTDQRNVSLMLQAMRHAVTPEDFAFIGHRGLVSRGKPDPEIYHHALHVLGLRAVEVLGVEDSPESASAAIAAGLPTIGFPGQYHRGRDFGPVIGMVDALDPATADLTEAA